MFQRDYILRAVEQAAQAIARVVGLMIQTKYDDAERELATGYAALGLDRELIGVLDAATFVRQLGDEQRIGAAVRLLICDAQLSVRRGNRARGRARLRLAQGLFSQLSDQPKALQDELDAAAAALQPD